MKRGISKQVHVLRESPCSTKVISTQVLISIESYCSL